jgi:hypothetical protein
MLNAILASPLDGRGLSDLFSCHFTIGESFSHFTFEYEFGAALE